MVSESKSQLRSLSSAAYGDPVVISAYDAAMQDASDLSVGQRVWAAAKARGITRAEDVGALGGVSRQAAMNWLRGARVNPKRLPAIAEQLGVLRAWLESGVGPRLAGGDGDISAEDGREWGTKDYNIHEPLRIIELGLGQIRAQLPDIVSGGSGHILADYWSMPKSLFKGRPHPAGDNYRIVEMDSEALEPRIAKGSRLLVNMEDVDHHKEGIFVVGDAHGFIIRHVQRVPGSSPEAIILAGEAGRIHPVQVDLERVTVVGRVVAEFRWL